MHEKPAIKLDPRNARKHGTRNRQEINASLRVNGAGRSILIDSENVLIGGNGVFDEAQSIGLPVRIIDSDGSELIAIRRTDLKTADAKRKALALADNRTNDLSEFDDEAVNALFRELGDCAAGSGFSPDEIAALAETFSGNDNGADGSPDGTESPDDPEVPFSEELLEKHNYLVLYFDNEVDWLQARTLFDVRPVKDFSSRPGYSRRGIGRVLNGAKALNAILHAVETGGTTSATEAGA